jgi:hypothetical protein
MMMTGGSVESRGPVLVGHIGKRFILVWLVFSGALGFSAFLLLDADSVPLWCLAFFVVGWVVASQKVLATPTSATVSGRRIKVNTAFLKRFYYWDNIAGIEGATSAAVPLARLRLRSDAVGKSPVRRTFARLTGGLGMLPDLNGEQLALLGEALTRARPLQGYRDSSFGRDRELTDPISNDDATTAAALRLLMGRCEALGSFDDVRRVGCLASMAMVDYQRRAAALRKSVVAGEWAELARLCEDAGEPEGDWVQLQLLERENGDGAVVEFFLYFRLELDDQCVFVRPLSKRELVEARMRVKEWILMDPR